MRRRFFNYYYLFIAVLSVATIGGTALYLNKEKFDPVTYVEAAVDHAPGYTPQKTYVFGDKATYYNGISENATGNALLSSLQSLNNTKLRNPLSYSSGGTSTSKSSFVYTDYASVV